MNCLFFYTLYNLHSVTNATANAIATEVTNRNTAITNAINTEVTNRNTAIANAQNISVGYSYTDRFTGGYWVDGRAVYRKTLIYSNVAFNNQTQLPTYIATNATIISMLCIAYDTAGNFFNVPYYNVYGNYSLAYYLNANKVINLVASTNDSVYYFHFIIEYAL